MAKSLTWDDFEAVDDASNDTQSSGWDQFEPVDSVSDSELLANWMNQSRSGPLAPVLGHARGMYYDKLDELTKLPVVGGLASVAHDTDMMGAATRIRENRATANDIHRVSDYVLRNEEKANAPLYQKVIDTIGSLPATAGEFTLTGGAFSAAKKAATAGVGRAMPAIVSRAVGNAAGIAAQTVANPQLVAASTARRMVPDISPQVNSSGDFADVQIGPDKDFGTALVRGLGDTAIELASERAGGHITGALAKIPGLDRIAALKNAVVQRWLAKPGRTTEMLDELVKQVGWDGPLAEILEERAGDLARMATGIESPEQNVTGQLGSAAGHALFGDPVKAKQLFKQAAEQLTVEGLAFSVPGVANVAARGLAKPEPQTAANDPELQSKLDKITSDYQQEQVNRGQQQADQEAATDQYDLGQAESEKQAGELAANENERRAFGDRLSQLASRQSPVQRQPDPWWVDNNAHYQEQQGQLAERQAAERQKNEADEAELAQQEQELYVNFYSDPASAADYVARFPEQAKKIAAIKTLGRPNFQPIDPDLPQLDDAPTMRRWQRMVAEFANDPNILQPVLQAIQQQQLPDNQRDPRAWQLLPQGVAPPNNPAIEVKDTAAGKLFRFNPVKKSDTLSQNQETQQPTPSPALPQPSSNPGQLPQPLGVSEQLPPVIQPKPPAVEALDEAQKKRLGVPEQKPKDDSATTIRRGKVGDMLASGEVVLTATGRPTTPFPDVKTDTERKTANTLKAVDKWLYENAVQEARLRGDDFNERQFLNKSPRNLPPATKDAMEQYLFGEEQPPVPKSILKPLTPKPSEVPQNAPEKVTPTEQPADKPALKHLGKKFEPFSFEGSPGAAAGLFEPGDRIKRSDGKTGTVLDPSQAGDLLRVQFDDDPNGVSHRIDARKIEGFIKKNQPTQKPAQPKPESKVDFSKASQEDIEAALLKEMLGEQPEAAPQQQAAPTQPASQPEPQPKRVFQKKPTIKEQASTARDEYKAALDEAVKAIKEAGLGMNAPLNPKVAAAVVKVAAKGLKAGVLTFADFVNDMSQAIGRESTIKLRAYLQKAWDAAVKLDQSGQVKAEDYDKFFEGFEGKKLGRPDYGTVEAPNRVALGEYFGRQLSSGKSYDNISEARKQAGELLGGTVEPGTPAAKDVDEAVEIGVVQAAREISRDGSDAEIFDKLLDLSRRQPNLGVRTSTSMLNQAYSTPAPLAWVANVMADVKPGVTVYDSSAGNGMLLIGPGQTIANELDPQRAAAIKSDRVSQQDATEYRPSEPVDRVIINPPFGAVNDEANRRKAWNINGLKTDKVDHAIVANTLPAMKDDGLAVLIIGSKGFEAGKPKADMNRAAAYSGDKGFYDHVWDNYNVVDHFTVSGDLYARQGAKFPIDVIVIHGKGASARPKPYNFKAGGLPAVISTWEELKDEKLKRPLVEPRGTVPGSTGPAGRKETDVGAVPGENGGQGGQASGGPKRLGSRSGSTVGQSSGGNPSNQKAPAASGNVGVSTTPSGAAQPATGSVSDERGAGRQPERGSGEPGSGPVVSGDRAANRRLGKEKEVDAETEHQISYQPGSANESVGTLVPRTQAAAIEKALKSVQEKYGDIDQFVSSQLGYSQPELGKYFSAEQIDALAMIIAKHREGKAFILGDQTGVGKGRCCAAMLRYAKMHNMVPVFVTQDPSLFRDMVRDLGDIGMNTKDKPYQPLPTNDLSGKKVVNLPDGRTLKQTSKKANKNLSRAIDSFLAGGGLKAGDTEYDAIFTTYSQVQPVKGELVERHKLLDSVADRAFFVLDESHNAGGSGELSESGEESRWQQEDDKITRAEIVRNLINKAKGVTFLSATFAKRPEVMDLYAKTGIADAVTSLDKLASAIQSGGVPLQQAVSEMLSEGGVYLRRERSYDGVEFKPKVVDVDLSLADSVSSIYRAIHKFDEAKNNAVEEGDVEGDVISGGGELGDDTATGDAGLTSTSFSSILWNLTDQLLMALKADSAAQEAIDSHKRGEVPIIAVDNTIESGLKYYLEDNPTEPGGKIDFTFRDLLRRYLERSREILVKHDKKDPKSWERIRLTDEQLGERGVELYEAALEMIEGFDGNLPASPIDWMRMRLKQADLRVSEITGRKQLIGYKPNGEMTLEERPEDEIGNDGKGRTVDAFNSGDLDVIILNRSGATGLSLHASEKFKNQKPRHMVIAQPAKNIDEFMQVLGRIHRTGQVTKPRYSLLMSNAPAETRPAAVLVKKLAGLNANVTASAKGSVSFDVPDVINKVGDQIISDYLVDNPEMNEELGSPLEIDDRTGRAKKSYNLAKKVTGRVVLLPVEQQQQFWDDVVQAYNDEIAELDRTNQNPLIAKTIDIAAKTVESFTIFQGDKDSDSPFKQPGVMEKVRAKKVGEPMKPDEVKAKVDAWHGGSATEQKAKVWAQEKLEAARKYVHAELEAKLKDVDDPEKQQKIKARYGKMYADFAAALRNTVPGYRMSFHEYADGVLQDVTSGVVIDLKRKGKSKNVASLSSWVAEVALTSPDRIARIPLSRIAMENATAGEGETKVMAFTTGDFASRESYDDFAQPNSTHETRFIGTGNILAAAGELSSKGGRVVFFTRDDGTVSRGVMMPRSFNGEKWSKDRPVVFKDVDNAYRFLTEVGGSYLVTADEALAIRLHNGEFVITAPKSKTQGGKYTTNRPLLAAAAPHEFVSVGARMEMSIPKAKGKAVLKAVLAISTLQTNSHKVEAKNLLDEGLDGLKSDRLSLIDTSTKPKKKLGRQEPTQQIASPLSQKVPISLAALSSAKRQVSARDIVATMAKEFDVPLKYGRVPKPASGIYRMYSEVVRVRGDEAGSLAVETHEIAHHVDKQTEAVSQAVGGLKRPRWTRLIQRAENQYTKFKAGTNLSQWGDRLDKAGAPPAVGNAVRKADFATARTEINNTLGPADPLAVAREQELRALDYYPSRGDLQEGFAEFARHWLTRDDAKSKAPEMTKWFEGTWLPAHAKYAAAFKHAKELITEYRNMTSEERAKQNRTSPGTTPQVLDQKPADKASEWAGSALDKLSFEWADTLHYLDKMEKEAVDKGLVRPKLDNTITEVAKWADGTTLNHVKAALLGDGIRTINKGRVKVLSPSLKQIFEPIGSPEEADDWDTYHVARHVLEIVDVMRKKNRMRRAQGQQPVQYNPGMRYEDAQAIVDRVKADPAKYKKFEKISEDFSKFRDSILDMRANAGEITYELADKLKQYYKKHASLRRVQPTTLMQRIFSRGGALNIGGQVRKRSLRGSGQPLMPQLDAVIMDLTEGYHSAMIHVLKQKILGTVVANPALGFRGVEGMGKWAEVVDPNLQPNLFRLDEILGQLVKKNVIDAEDAKLIRAVDRLRNGGLTAQDLKLLKSRYGTSHAPILLSATKDVPDLNEILITFKPDYRPSASEYIERLMVNGKPVLVEWNPHVYETFQAMGPMQLSAFERTLAGMADLQRLGATGLNMRFGVQQLFSDYFTYQFQAKQASVKEAATQPLKMLGKISMGVVNDMLGGDKLPSLSLLEENYGSLFEDVVPDQSGVQLLRGKLFAKNMAAQVAHVAADPTTWAKTLHNGVRKIGNVLAGLDLPARLAEGTALLKSFGYVEKQDSTGKWRWFNEQSGNFEDPPIEVQRKFLVAVADATVSFRRGGRSGRYVNRVLFPYFNAWLQGTLRMADTIKQASKGDERAIAGLVAGTAAAVSMSVLMKLLSRGGDDEEKEQFYKSTNWSNPVMRIRKPQSWSWVPNLAEALLDLVSGKTGSPLSYAAEELRQQSYFELPGLDDDPILGNISKIGTVGPLAEAVSNRDTFRDRKIEGSYLEGLPPADRHDARTSEAAKQVAKATGPTLGLGPKRVEHLANRMTGGLMTRNPLANPFKPYQTSVSRQELEDKLDEMKSRRTAAKYHGKPWTEQNEQEYDRLDWANRVVGKLYKQMDGQPEAEKDRIQKYVTGMARYALGKDPLPEYPDPMRDYKNVPEEVRQLVDDHILTLSRKVTAGRPSTLTPKEKESGLTVPKKVANWESERHAAVEALHNLGMETEQIAQAVYRGFKAEMKDPQAISDKMTLFRRQTGYWKKLGKNGQ